MSCQEVILGSIRAKGPNKYYNYKDCIILCFNKLFISSLQEGNKDAINIEHIFIKLLADNNKILKMK